MCVKLFWGLMAATYAMLVVVGIGAELARKGRCGLRRDTMMRIKNVESALVHFQTENDFACPASLKVLVDERIVTRVPLDEWDQPLLFTCPGVHNPDGADIVSAGQDHAFGTADDIRSWDL